MKDPAKFTLDVNAVAKILALHMAEASGLQGKWSVTFSSDHSAEVTLNELELP